MKRLALVIPLTFCVFSAQAQAGDTHACIAEPAIQKLYDDHRSSPDRIEVLREAMKAHPDDLFLNRWLILTQEFRPGVFAAEYKTRLEAHPDEPLSQYLYGLALTGADTPHAIRLIGHALAQDPEIGMAYEALAKIYASPRFRDRAKVAEYLRAHTERCQQSLDAYSYLREIDAPQALHELTAKFRRAVESLDTPASAVAYKNLWTAEFRIADPKARDRIRDEVRTDMQRIRKIDPKDTNESESLIEGFRLLGDEAAADALREKQTPRITFERVFENWRAAHPVSDHAGAEAFAVWYEAMYQASAQWVKDWPRETNSWNWRMVAAAHRTGASTAEIEKAGEDVLISDSKTFQGRSANNPYPLYVAEEWERHDIRLEQCVRLLKQAMAQLDGNSASNNDLLAPFTIAAFEIPHNAGMIRFRIWITESKVELKLKNLDAARSVAAQMKVWIDQHPDDSEWQTKIWHDYSGALAEADEHKLEALVHYQQGTQSTPLKRRARKLWSDLGGTPPEFNVWFKPPAAAKSSVANSIPTWSWQDRALTFFNARDLAGKTWTIADLKGRKTLLVVWATWCQPCRAELPYVQKFYEETKNRQDTQTITVSIDENSGLIEPFLKAGGYTFPVLHAPGLADDIGDTDAIPRVLIVDTNGILRKESIRLSAADWPQNVLSMLTASQ